MESVNVCMWNQWTDVTGTQESGNKEVLYMHLDLGSLKSVRSFAENFLKKESRLDILINNAGSYQIYAISMIKLVTFEDSSFIILGLKTLY